MVVVCVHMIVKVVYSTFDALYKNIHVILIHLILILSCKVQFKSSKCIKLVTLCILLPMMMPTYIAT